MRRAHNNAAAEGGWQNGDRDTLYYFSNTHRDMFEHIDPRSSTPLYAQIAARFRVAIAAGELRTAPPLPSVRDLAARPRGNPATIPPPDRQPQAEGVRGIPPRPGAPPRELAP